MNDVHSPSSAPPAPRSWRIAAALVLALHGLLVLFTFRHYGMSWDQPSSHDYGQAVVRFYQTWGEDKTAQNHWLRPYGGLFEIVGGIVETATGWDWFRARTLATALFGWLGVFAILRAGWVTFGPAVGVTAGALLLLTPTYYGHQFINPKDLPFAALSMLAIRYILQLAKEYPRLRWGTVLKTGVAFGGALGVRIGGLQLLGVIGTAVLFALWRERRDPAVKSAAHWARWIGQGTALVTLAWAVMLACWPYALSAPITGPFAALKEFSKFWWDGLVFYDGRLVKTSDLPWAYIPNLLGRTLPEAALLGLAGGTIAVGLALRRGRGSLDHPDAAGIAAVLAAVVLPVAAIWILQARVYDGLRHVLFIFPPIVLLAAVGLHALARAVGPSARTVWWCAVGALAAVTAGDMRALHPYQYIYFNRAVAGGLPVANQGYDLDYWATGLREAAEWVARNYNPTPGQPLVYSASAEPEQVEVFLRPSPESKAIFRRAAPGEKARLFLIIRRNRQHLELTWGRTLHTVSRQGVPLVDIVEAP